MLQYLIFNPRVVVWMLWLASQGLFIHIFFLIGHKVNYNELVVKDLKQHAILSTFSTLGLIANGNYETLTEYQCWSFHKPEGSILFRLIPVFATRKMKLCHMIVFVIALGFASWDLLMVPKANKHFHSPHSICGFLTYVIFGLMVSLMTSLNLIF